MNGAMHVSLAALILAGCAFAQDDFASQMAKGIEAFRHAYFAESVQSFEHAVALDPKSPLAHISLALAYLQAYIAGVESPESHSAARNAEEHLREALAVEPRNTVALGYLAQFCHGESRIQARRLSEAERLYQRILEVEPNSKEAFYALGVIAFEKTQHLDDAIKQFSRALEIDPGYEDATQFLGLVLREKSERSEDKEEAARYRTASDQWISKALQIRTARQEQWLAAHPKTGNEPPCPPHTMCFDPDPGAADAKPPAWPPVWWGMMIPPPPPPPPPRPPFR